LEIVGDGSELCFGLETLTKTLMSPS